MQVKCKVSNHPFRRTPDPTLQRQYEWCVSHIMFEPFQTDDFRMDLALHIQVCRRRKAGRERRDLAILLASLSVLYAIRNVVSISGSQGKSKLLESDLQRLINLSFNPGLHLILVRTSAVDNLGGLSKVCTNGLKVGELTSALEKLTNLNREVF